MRKRRGFALALFAVLAIVGTIGVGWFMMHLQARDMTTSETIPMETELSADAVETENTSNIEDTLALWTGAVCNRDGAAIRSMASDEVIAALEESEYLSGDSFGFSSPWPWEEEDYQIVEATDTNAVILYYAQTSDPHITVMREEITFTITDGTLKVTEETLLYMDSIDSVNELEQSYPESSLVNTNMDYATNGLGEALNDNALLSSTTVYLPLFQPDTAAVMLLNLSTDESKVKCEAVEEKEDGSVCVTILFTEEQKKVEVTMVSPYGEAEIWIPQEYSEVTD